MASDGETARRKFMDTQVMERPPRVEANPQFLVELFEDRARDYKTAQVGRPPSVYQHRLTAEPPLEHFDKVPWCVYFYYVRLDTDGRLRVKHYYYDPGVEIPYDSLQQVLQHLVDNVRGDDNNPGSNGSDFKGIVWGRKSYIAFFIDEESWSLYKNGDAMEGISFDHSPTPNHTFFDGIDLKLKVTSKKTGAVTERSAIAFVNHMKRSDAGDDLDGEGEKQDFKFEMIFRVKFADDTTAPLTVIFDPDGTNMGPPVPPP
jgi:hypothetical protein